jgi:hypothetical protein
VTNPEDEDIIKGAHFESGAAYVDYDSAADNDSVTDITKTLLKKEFIVLEKQVEI